MSVVDKVRRNPAGIIRVLVTVVLGGIGAAAGFTHTHDWAVHNGQTGWLAWADAVVIEGMAVVAGFELHRDHHRTDKPTRRITFPAIVLVTGLTIQMAAQVALAPRTPAGWLLAAMPALGFLVVVKLLMRRTPAPTREPATEDHPAPLEHGQPTTPEASTPAPTGSSATTAGETGLSSRVKLPPALLNRIAAVLHEARNAGREPSTADVRRVVRLPEDTAAQVLADLTPTAV